MVVAYRTDISTRDRSGAIAAVIAIHLLLLFMLLHLNGAGELPSADSVLKVLSLSPPPPPPPPPPPQQKMQPKPKEKEGGSAPPNFKSQATPVEAPKPQIVIPPVPQIASSETPREGTQITQGAAPFAGPGTGAGGTGNGTGNGSGGNGPGGGGDNGAVEPPHLSRPFSVGAISSVTCSINGRRGRRFSCACASTLAAMLPNAPSTTVAAWSHRFHHLQHRTRPPPLPSRGQPKRTGGCRMVRIRATSASVEPRESNDRSGMVGI